MDFGLFTIFGVLGVLFIAYGIWAKKENHQDILFLIGGIFLLAYSIYIKDVIFIVLQSIYIISVSAELVNLNKKH